MDYFAVGGRPLLNAPFPGLLAQRRGYQPEWQLWGECAREAPPDEAVRRSKTRPPVQLPVFFHPNDVEVWKPERFETIQKIQEAVRNRGHVHLMRDLSNDNLVAVKQMPNSWVCRCHEEFIMQHPSETELPWQDIGCVKYLNSQEFEYCCDLDGVFRDDSSTYVVTSYASCGDLFAWCEGGPSPGPEREKVIAPLARQILRALMQLHDLTIVHRDVSLENILLNEETSSEGEQKLCVKIIDFGMSSTMRRFRSCVRGKSSYQAPELHTDRDYDAFLSDAFSLGVTLYAMVFQDYPWLSTRPGGCKCFEFVRKSGLRAYMDKRNLRNSKLKVGSCSEPLKQLLEGLLAIDPDQRLTLGESCWTDGRRSVWDEPWLQTGLAS